jgi:hypothetical protein
MPQLPTVAEMEKWMREKMPGIKIYSPHDDFLPLEVHGRTDLYATPDLGGEIRPHPITEVDIVCDGITEIRGRYPNQKDSSGKKIEGQDANAIVHFLISKHPYGELGLTWVPGDRDIDNQIKEASQSIHREYRFLQDEQIVGRRSEFKANWEKNPQMRGRPVPPPSEIELAAMDRLQERRLSRKKYLFECDVEGCPGYAANQWPKFARHMEASHGYSAEELTRLKKRMTSPETGLSDKVVKAAEDVDPEMRRQVEKAESERPQRGRKLTSKKTKKASRR